MAYQARPQDTRQEGTMLANLMFSAPYKDIQIAIQQRGHLGDLNPTPWAFMLGNCCGWVTYSFLKENYWIFFAKMRQDLC